MMKPEEIRNITWEGIQDRLCGLRHMVYLALAECANPVTTRQLAANMSVDLLNVRPRMTELVDLGLAVMVASECGHRKHEGLYRAVPLHDARAAHDRRHQIELGNGERSLEFAGANSPNSKLQSPICADEVAHD